jgi:hypothetical protein
MLRRKSNAKEAINAKTVEWNVAYFLRLCVPGDLGVNRIPLARGWELVAHFRTTFEHRSFAAWPK